MISCVIHLNRRRIAYYLDRDGSLPPDMLAKQKRMKIWGIIVPCIRLFPCYNAIERKAEYVNMVRGAQAAARAHYDKQFGVESKGEEMNEQGRGKEKE